MELPFSCPECKGQAMVRFTDDEAKKVRDRIVSEGRSPTIIVKCEKGHELLVTLYNSKDGLGIRDVLVPVRTGTKKASEMEWIKSAFGGGK